MPKRKLCIEGACFDTIIDVEDKTIEYREKECPIEAKAEWEAFKKVYKDKDSTMRLTEKVK